MTVGDSVGNKPGHGAAGGLKAAALHVLSVHGLLVFGIALVIVFALLLPATFTGSQNFRAILGNNTTVALLAMAEMIVIATGNYDLSIAYNVGLMHIVAMGLLTDAMVPWPLVVILTIAAGGLVGWINGVLVEYAKIDSFIATLGVGTILYGFGTWYTNGTQLVGNVPQAFADLNDARLLVMGAFVCSGLIVGLAGVLLAARLQVAQSSVGPEFLLPAFVGALLGATTVRPGRVNAWGTIIAVLVLAIGIAGLQQLGNSFFAEPIFQGTALIVSVGLAGYAARRRKR